MLLRYRNRCRYSRVELYDTIIAGDIEKAKVLQKTCADITSLVITPHGYEQPAVQKAVLTARLGINCGEPRLPTLPLKPEVKASSKAHRTILTAAHCAGACMVGVQVCPHAWNILFDHCR
jgi:dihydrodipicolinate synthase/N-acetylneuraminate lyase